MVRSKPLLSEQDSQRIEAAVTRLEERSATELVVAVVPRSGDYWAPRVLLATSWALGLVLGLHLLLPTLGAVSLLLAQIPAGCLVYWLSGLPAFGRLLLSERATEAAVQRRAFALFAERGIHNTRDRTGLLILLSELEHRVVVLGDSGLWALVGEAGFKGYADEVIRRVREGQAAEGILEVIRRLETVVAAAPRRSDDVNELPNAVMQER